MSLLERTKAALQKKSEEEPSDKKNILEPTEEEEESSSEDEMEFEKEFDFMNKKWVLAPHMEEISNGQLNLIPVECLFTHYILKYGFHCLYIALDDHESGDDFEVYEFDWMEDFDFNGDTHEKWEPDFKVVESSLTASECGRFLADRIKEGYRIYIEERKEFGE